MNILITYPYNNNISKVSMVSLVAPTLPRLTAPILTAILRKGMVIYIWLYLSAPVEVEFPPAYACDPVIPSGLITFLL